MTPVCRLEHAPNAELMAAFSREASNKLREFAPQNISNMLWAYATLGHSPGDTSLVAAALLVALFTINCCVVLQLLIHMSCYAAVVLSS